jgi:hypothetical protein
MREVGVGQNRAGQDRVEDRAGLERIGQDVKSGSVLCDDP